jgi:glucan phosphorylase
MGVRLSRYVNGVTTAHMNFSWLLFPAFHIRAVTNGVHPIGSCNMNVTVVSGNVTEV